MTREIVTYTAPAYWASYLMDGDATGFSLSDTEEQAECDAWIESVGLGSPVGCREIGFEPFNDATNLGGDVYEFDFYADV